jgi:hypothetical protein
MIISQDPEAIRHAQALQTQCELRRVALHACHASTDGRLSDAKPPFALRLNHNSVAHAILEGILRIEVAFQIQGFDSTVPPMLLFSIDCTFDLDYAINNREYQPTEESISAFKDGNAVFNCWPYARELAQSLTTRMEFQPPPLPLLRIVPAAQKEQTAEAETYSTTK